MVDNAIVLSTNPYHLKIVLNGTPKATNDILGHSYWKKHNNAVLWKKKVKSVVYGLIPESPLELVTLTLTRKSNRFLDYDGLVASFKPVVDSLVENKILKNDTYKITGNWIVTQEFRKLVDGPLIEIEVKEEKNAGN